MGQIERRLLSHAELKGSLKTAAPSGGSNGTAGSSDGRRVGRKEGWKSPDKRERESLKGGCVCLCDQL